MAIKSKSEKVPKDMQDTFQAIAELTDKFCKDYLNEEYARLARQVNATLCRKQLSPLKQGKVNGWACGIMYALGFVNFLFDNTQNPHMTAIELCKKFGVGKSTGGSKAKIVRDILNMSQLDPNWCLPSKMDRNPLAWMIKFNGLLVDVRSMPREIQEIAFEKGLIPYIPADKAE